MTENVQKSERTWISGLSSDGLKDAAYYLKYTSKTVQSLPGVVNGTRCQWLEGKILNEALCSDDFAKKFRVSLSEQGAKSVIKRLLEGKFLVCGKCEKSPDEHDQNFYLSLMPKSASYKDDAPYIWLYERSQWRTFVMLGLVVLGVLAVLLHSLWPPVVRKGVWYLSCTLLVVIIVFSVIRLILFAIFWLVGYEFWILPNCFDDNLSLKESFSPFVSMKKTEDPNWIARIIVIGVAVAFALWFVKNQPVEMSTVVDSQKHLIEDLYTGKLFSRLKGSPTPAEAGAESSESQHQDSRTEDGSPDEDETPKKEEPHIPSLEQILSETADIDEDELMDRLLEKDRDAQNDADDL